MRPTSPAAILATLAGILGMVTRSGSTGSAETVSVEPGMDGSASAGLASLATARLPLATIHGPQPCFEADSRSCEGPVRFRLSAAPATFFVTGDGLMAVTGRGGDRASAWSMRFVGGASRSVPVGEGRLPGEHNRYLGTDPRLWRTGIACWDRLRQRDVWAGIDVVHRYDGGRFRYDFEVAPGADPTRIALEFEGIDGLRVRGDGSLSFSDDGVEVVHGAPTILQGSGGSIREVAGRWVLESERTVRFEVGGYDRAVALLIDPTIDYAVHLGGSQEDRVHGVAVDGKGVLLLAGSTWSADFPTRKALEGVFAGGSTDIFVTAIAPNGAGILWSTFLGGRKDETAYAVAADGDGDVYVGGESNSTDFPTTTGWGLDPWDLNPDGEPNGVVLKLAHGGRSLLASRYFGSPERSAVTAIRILGTDIVIAGFDRGGWPVGDVIGSRTGWTVPRGGFDVGVARLSGGVVRPEVKTFTLKWSYLIGGSGDEGQDIGLAVGPAGEVFVTGSTSSTDFPTTRGACEESFPGGTVSGFLTCIAPVGNQAIAWSTFLGGSGEDRPQSVSRNLDGTVWIGGTTTSTDFPLKDPFQASPSSMFLARMKPILKPEGAPPGSKPADQLLNASYFGSTTGSASLEGLVSDLSGRVHLFGHTGDGFPVTGNAWQPLFAGGGSDLFFATVAPDGGALEFASFLGSAGADEVGDGGDALVIDPAGNLYLGGTVDAGSDLPAAGTAVPIGTPGGRDLLVVRAYPETGIGGAALDLFVRRGTIRDDPGADRDSLSLTVDLGTAGFPPRQVFSPATDALDLQVGFQGQRAIEVRVDAGDPGWRSNPSATVHRWRSTGGQTPRVTLSLDLRRGVLSARIAGAEFKSPAAPPVALDLALGDLSGRYGLDWVQRRPGLLVTSR